MSKHTPGPWKWTTDNSGPEDERGCATRGPVDMATFKTTGYSNNPELWAGEVCILSAGGGEYNPMHSCPADAHLIAAAPEMYAALARVMKHYGMTRGNDVFGVVAALAKAEGNQPREDT